MYLNGAEKMILYTVKTSKHPFLETGDQVYRHMFDEVIRIRGKKVKEIGFFTGMAEVEVICDR